MNIPEEAIAAAERAATDCDCSGGQPGYWDCCLGAAIRAAAPLIAAQELRKAAQRLRDAATGRRDYLANLPAGERAHELIEAECAAISRAARVVEGDVRPLVWGSPDDPRLCPGVAEQFAGRSLTEDAP